MSAEEAANIACPFEKCQDDLTQIALLFCLRSCKYTKKKSHRQTVQFHLKYLQFHDTDRIIPHNAPSNKFLCARSVTLLLDTQKNNILGESTTMKATGLSHSGAVSAAT